MIKAFETDGQKKIVPGEDFEIIYVEIDGKLEPTIPHDQMPIFLAWAEQENPECSERGAELLKWLEEKFPEKPMQYPQG